MAKQKDLNPETAETAAVQDEHNQPNWPGYSSQTQDNLPSRLRQKRQQFMLEIVNEVGQYITSILDLDTLLWEVTRYTREVFNAYGTAVGLVEGRDIVLRIGIADSGQNDIVRTPVKGDTAAARALTQRQSRIITDITAADEPLVTEVLAGARTQMIVPIMYNEQNIGVLCVFSDEAHAFSENDLTLLEMLAEHVAIAVINARLIAKQQVETWGSAILLRVARILGGMSDQQDLAHVVLGLALDLTGAEYGMILTFENLSTEDEEQYIFPSNDTVLEAVRELGTAWQAQLRKTLASLDQLRIAYANYAEPELEPLMGRLEVEVAMLAPIRVEDDTWGVLILGYVSAHRFTRYDFNLIAGLAAQASAAIANARLFQRVQQERSYLQAVIANTGEGLFLVNPEGQVTYCNPRLEELIGVNYRDVLGTPYQELFREIAALSDFEQDTQEQLTQALENLNHQPTVHLLASQPVVYRLQISFFPILNARTQLIGWGGLVRDVTAEWAEITRRTEFLSSVTHELRTSLAAMKGFVTTLLASHRYWGERERQDFLENIDRSVDELSRMLENAQEMSRLDIGAINLERQPTDIQQLIQRAIKHPDFRADVDRITVSVSDNLPAPQIDGPRIEQALQNLLSTALKYSPVDHKVHLRARAVDDAVQISVTNRGHIPEEQLTYIYDRFYQNESMSADALKGPGLGLYVARGLIVAHGGRIWVENTESKTTLSFTLPLEARQPLPRTQPPREAQPAQQMRAKPRFETEVRPPRQTLKTLVIEDDPYMVRLLKINLEAAGYSVISATRGNVAIELASTEQPDIILLDVRLPDIDGFEVCTRIREFNTIVPIIMITGQATDDEIVRGLTLGADDYMRKPISHKELLARMQSCLKRSWMTGQTPASDPIFRNGDLVIDFSQRQVIAHGRPVKLTPTEYKLLYHLAINAGRVMTHEQLLSAVWGPGCEDQTQYLWVNISRLRGKLEKDPANPEYILTESGIGYLLGKA